MQDGLLFVTPLEAINGKLLFRVFREKQTS
jgi:hypothetical protein